MAGRPPPSFKTDVNRQKTKKWTDAKAYSYEGDDWGGYDEFGEYGNYDQPKPASTGFRQPGQALPPVNTNVYSSSPANAPGPRPRINSFDMGDERRNFSAGAGPPPGMASAPQSATQRTQSPRTVSQPISNAPYEQPSGGYYPPRQSSLTQDETPPASLMSQQEAFSQQSYAPVTQSTASESAPSDLDPAAARTTSPKPFTFIRPADIYKRIEEEKERERRSMDSNRTSLESVERARREDRSSLTSPSPRLRESSGSPGGMRSSLQPVPERKSEYGFDGVSIPDYAPQQVQPKEPEPEPHPEPVSVAAPQPAPAPAPVATPQSSLAPAQSFEPAPATTAERQFDVQPTAPSNGPLPSLSLPQFGRFSGFANDFWSTSSSSYPWEGSATSSAAPTTSTGTAAATIQTSADQDQSLQPQPSPGFRSAVKHAFDANNQVQSPGPISGQGSQRSAAGSELSASNSSTTGISPIMSRVPSAATAAQKAQERSDLTTSSNIIEEGQENVSPEERPDSSSTLKGPTILSDGHSRDVSAGSASTATIPSGYRRDMSPPHTSTNASRNLTLQTEPPVPESSSAEFDRVSPSSNYTQTPASAATLAQYGTQGEAENASYEDSTAARGFQSSSGEASSAAASGTSSPGPNRVKKLASEFDEMHNSRSNSIRSNQSDRNLPLSSETQGVGTPFSRDLDGTSHDGTSHDGVTGDHSNPNSQLEVEGPRPQLPGSWVSYADSSQPNYANQSRDVDDNSITHTPASMQNLSRRATPSQESAETEQTVDLAPDSSSAESMGNQPSSSAMAAVTAAGSALAASVASAVGLKDDPADATTVSNDRDIDDVQTQPLTPQLNVSSAKSSRSGTPRIETGGQAGSDAYFSSPAPLRQANPSPIDTSFQPASEQDSRNVHTSFGDSEDELESDRLHQDIVRSLNQSGDDHEAGLSHTSPLSNTALTLPSPQSDDIRQSTAIPREYDSYWATGQFDRTLSTLDSSAEDQQSPQAIPTVEVSSEDAATGERQPQAAPGEPPSKLTKRFSWEEDDEDFTATPSPPVDGEPRDFATVRAPSIEAVSPVVAAQGSDRSMTASPVERYEPSPLAQPANESQYFGGQASSYAIPEITFGDPAEDEKTEKNFALYDPMAVKDQEPRAPEETAPEDEVEVARTSAESEEPKGVPSATASPPSTVPATKLAAFRDIMSMKQPAARIQSYNKTRDDFASMQTGLGDWLSHMVTVYPEHATRSSAPTKPTVNTGLASSVKTRLSPSMAKAMSPSGGSQPYYQQYLNSPGALPPTSSETAGSNSTAPDQVDTSTKNRATSGQMQTKGKDLLHSAGVLGGKASSGAKGLFAKGKSRLKQGSSDKGQASKSAPSRGILASKTNRNASQTSHAPLQSVAEPPTPPQLRTEEPAPSTPPKLTLPFEHTERSTTSIDRPDTRSSGLPSNSRGSPSQQISQIQSQQSSIEREAPVRGLEIYSDTSATTSPISHEGKNSLLGQQAISARDFSMSGRLLDANAIVESGGNEVPIRTSEEDKSSFDSFRTAHDDLSVGRDANLTSDSVMQSGREISSGTPAGGATSETFQQAPAPELLDVANHVLDIDREKSIRRRLAQSDEARRSLDFLESDSPRLELGTSLGLAGDFGSPASPQSVQQHPVLVDRNINSLPDVSQATNRQTKALSTASLDIALARLKEKDYDIGSPSPTSSVGSKDMRFTATEIHPAMREEFYKDTQIQRSRRQSAASSARSPAVNPASLPPSVRKQYEGSPLATTSFPNMLMDSQAAALDAGLLQPGQYQHRTDSQNELVKPPTLRDDATSRDTSVEGSSRGTSPWRRFRARSRGKSIDELEAMKRPATTEGLLATHSAPQDSSEPRNKSPFRRLRPRSRGKSLGEADALELTTSAESKPRGRSSLANAAKRLSMPPLPLFRPRSKGASVDLASEQENGSTEPHERELSTWQMKRARSRGGGAYIDEYQGDADERSVTTAEVSAWHRLRYESGDAYQGLSSQHSTSQKQTASVWRRLRTRSRGSNIEMQQEQEEQQEAPTTPQQQDEAPATPRQQEETSPAPQQEEKVLPSESPEQEQQSKARTRATSMDVDRHAPYQSSPLKQAIMAGPPEDPQIVNGSANQSNQQSWARRVSAPPSSYPSPYSSLPPTRFPRPLNAGRPRNLPHLQTNVGPSRPIMPAVQPGVHTPPLSLYAPPQSHNVNSMPERPPPRMHQRPERTSDMVFVPVASKEEAPPKSPEKKRRSWFGGVFGGSSSSSSRYNSTKQTRKLSKVDPRPAQLKQAEVSRDMNRRGRTNLTPLELEMEMEMEEQSKMIRIPINPPLSQQPDPDPLSRSQEVLEQSTQERSTGQRNRGSHKQYLQSHGILPAYPGPSEYPLSAAQPRPEFPGGRAQPLRHEKPLPQNPYDQRATNHNIPISHSSRSPPPSNQPRTLRRTSASARPAAMIPASQSPPRPRVPSTSQHQPHMKPVPPPPQFRYDADGVPIMPGPVPAPVTSPRWSSSRSPPPLPPYLMAQSPMTQTAHEPLAFAWEEDPSGANIAPRV